jgi:hypothetical protein
MANISNIDFIKIGIDQNGVVHYVNASGAWDILPLGGSGNFVETVTGQPVNNTDPFNPIINLALGVGNAVGVEPSDVMPNGGSGKVNFGITTTGVLQTKNSAGKQQFFVPTENILRYKAIISQTVINLYSGLLVVGQKYIVDKLEVGDNFTNVGYVSEGVIFTATGTTPTNWSNGSRLIDVFESQPIIDNVIFDTLPLTVGWGDDGSGNFGSILESAGLFNVEKTFFIDMTRVSDDLIVLNSGSDFSYLQVTIEVYP